MEAGGDGIYAAWKLSYQEPMFSAGGGSAFGGHATRNFAGKEIVLEAVGGLPEYQEGLCPVAERVQKQILAFKTNYWDWERAERQAEIIKKTIAHYGN